MVKNTIQYAGGFLILILWVGLVPAFAQIGSPIITNYPSAVFGATAQTWSIVQDKNGNMFYGTNVGVAKFNGSEWSVYKTPLNSAVRSLAINNAGIIYVGATREFGFLKPNNLGKYEYVSLSDSLPFKDFTVILKTFIIDDAVYFLANHQKIFKYRKGLVSEVKLEGITYFRGFLINKDIWLTDKSYGFARLINDSVVFYDNPKLTVDIYTILPTDNDKFLMGTLKEGLFQYDVLQKKWTKFENEADKLLQLGNVYHATVLKNGDLALATLKRGVFIISADGKLKYVFDKQSGLINNATYFVSSDAHSDLWIAQEKGISHVELSVPFNRFGVNSGIDGNIQKLTIYNNNLYCGTSSGIYCMPIDKEEPWNHKTFQQLSPDLIYNLDYCQIQLPNSNQNILLASFLRDLAVVYPDNHIESIHSTYGCYSISTSVKHPGRVFLGGANGVEVLDLSIENGKVKVDKSTQLTKMTESIRKIITAPNGDLWIQSAFNTLFRVSFDEQESLNNYQVFKYPQLSNTYPGIILTGMHRFNGKIFLTSNFGIFSADISLLSLGKQAFEPDLSMGLNFQKDSIAIQAMEKDAFGNYWFASSIGLLKYDISKDEIVLAEFKRLQGRAIQGIHISNHLGVSIISEEDIFILNQNYQKTPEYNFKVFFDEVEFGTDYLQQSFDGVFSSNCSLKQSIPSDQNNFLIKYSAAFFQKSESITYRYMLEGFEKQWSEPNKRQTVNYTNLPPGKYIFKVRAENIYNKQSNQAEFSFVIVPPWYQKPVALISFFVFIFALVWLFVFLYTLRLKNDKKKLQAIIKEAIHKEESQKEEIEKQAGKLYLANLELQKLSLVASKTDNAVSIMDNGGNIEWVNEGYSRLFGFSFGEVIHSKTDLLGEFADVTINEMVNLWFGDRKPIIFENQKATKYGTKVWVQTTLTPVLDEHKQVKNLIAIETDISRLKYAEFEIASQKDEIARQRDLALQQRDAITSQQKEIIDSILYAERIQKAVFNKETDLTVIFKDSFVYDKPRDIVSGDFFWVHEVDNLKLLAVVDSTGHGIPGAFMSLIGFTFLNSIIKENGILEPYQILNLMREKVISSLGQKGDDNEAKDGMDVSICVIDTRQKLITYAGANNKSYLINSQELIELEADKMPISIYITAKQSFTQKQINYQPNDVLYMFTDGYPDQFGGEHGKKFKSSRFKMLLKTLSKENYNKQKTMLDIEFLRWKGALNQVDDILIVGVNLE